MRSLGGIRCGRSKAAELGPAGSVGTPAEVVEFLRGRGDLGAVERAAGRARAGRVLAGKIVVDATNQFGGPPLPADGGTAAHFNAARMPGARCTSAVMEASRRSGAVYGQEYRAADARAVVEAVRVGGAIPPAPRYPDCPPRCHHERRARRWEVFFDWWASMRPMTSPRTSTASST